MARQVTRRLLVPIATIAFSLAMLLGTQSQASADVSLVAGRGSASATIQPVFIRGADGQLAYIGHPARTLNVNVLVTGDTHVCSQYLGAFVRIWWVANSQWKNFDMAYQELPVYGDKCPKQGWSGPVKITFTQQNVPSGTYYLQVFYYWQKQDASYEYLREDFPNVVVY